MKNSDRNSNESKVSQNSEKTSQKYQQSSEKSTSNISVHQTSPSTNERCACNHNMTPVYVVPVQQVPRRQVYRRGQRDVERSQPPEYSGFSDQDIRKVFVRKVYLILMIQLSVTAGVIALFVFEPHVKHFVQTHAFVEIIAFGIFFAVFIGLACCGDIRRQFPANIIMLSIFTLAASYLFGVLSSRYRTDAILMAVAICAAVCFAVTLFSFNTKFDFTTCGGILCMLLIVLIIFGIVNIFIHTKVMTMIYGALGAIIFTMYLAYDTQMLMGGKTNEIHPEEYILAAILIYLDVLYIFMFILMLFDQK